MNDQLQDLLKRVYEEGVAKAKAEADTILEQANSNAQQIINNAERQAQEIVAKAEKNAADLKKNTDSDLQMAANHSLSAVKQKITDLILNQSLNTKIGEAFNDVEFMKKLIMEAVSAWKSNFEAGTLTISESMKPQLDEYFISSIKSLFKSEFVVDFSPVMKKGFQISPQDGTYKLVFSEDDFANLYKVYLRPRSKDILFSN